MKQLIQSEKGMMLPMVLIIMVVLSVFGTAVLLVTAHDFEHSIHDENQTQAYYYARSSIEIVMGAIDDELDEALLLAVDLENAINAYNDYNNTEDENYESFKQSLKEQYEAALDLYQEKVNRIYGYVLPLDGGSMTHVVDGIQNGDDVDVTVTRSGNTLRFTADAEEDGIRGEANLKVEMEAQQMNYDLVYTTVAADPPTVFNFEYGMYAFGDLETNNALTLNNTQAAYGGDFYPNGDLNGDMSPLVLHDSTVVPVSASTLLPIDYTTLSVVNAEIPRETMTASDSGYYVLEGTDYGKPSAIEMEDQDGNKRINVDTTDGDVIIRVDNLHIEGDLRVHVTGDNMFYIYVRPQDSNDYFYSKNKTYFTSHDDTPRTMILVEGGPAEGGDADLSGYDGKPEYDGMIVFEGEGILYGYIYSPYNGIYMNNKPEVFGSVYGENIFVENNTEVTHTSLPGGGTGVTGTGDPVTETVTTPNVIDAAPTLDEDTVLWLRP